MNKESAQQKVENLKRIIISQRDQQKNKLKEQAQDAYGQQLLKKTTQQNQRIDRQYEKNNSQLQIDSRINKSAKINQSRLRKMGVRSDLINDLKDDVRKKIQQLVLDQNKYKVLLKNLIIQGLIKLNETQVEVRALSRDIKIVKDIMPDCQQQFSLKIKQQTGKDITVKLIFNKNPLEQQYRDLLGGVVMSCLKGKIKCANTIDMRIDLAFQESLPDMRHSLFA